jgi:hypothetical protein
MTDVKKQVSGDAPPVTAAVTAELQRVHLELDAAMAKAVRMRGLIVFGLALVFCMQVAILAIIMMHNGQAPRVEAPALRDVPRHRLLCDVVKRNPHDGDGVVVCQYLPEVTGDVQVFWEHMKSSWTYVAQNLRNMTSDDFV